VRNDFVQVYRLDAYLNDVDRRRRHARPTAEALSWLRNRMAPLRTHEGAVTARTMRMFFLRCLETAGVPTRDVEHESVDDHQTVMYAMDGDGSIVLALDIVDALGEKNVRASRATLRGVAATRLVFGPWLTRDAVAAAGRITAHILRAIM